MKKILFPIVILAMVVGGIALVSSTKKGPVLYIRDKAIDFGIKDVQEKLERSVLVKNVGSEDLVIDKIDTDCGCTAALLSQKILPPGGEGKILVTVSPKKTEKNFIRHVTLHTNDPEATTFTVSVSGTITLIYAVDPQELDFHEVSAGKGAEATLTLQKATEDHVSITGVQTETKYLHVEDTRSPDGVLTFMKVVLSQGTPVGDFQDSLRVKTSSVIRPEITIPVKAKILP